MPLERVNRQMRTISSLQACSVSPNVTSCFNAAAVLADHTLDFQTV
jgi:hypothetical protein